MLGVYVIHGTGINPQLNCHREGPMSGTCLSPENSLGPGNLKILQVVASYLQTYLSESPQPQKQGHCKPKKQSIANQYCFKKKHPIFQAYLKKKFKPKDAEEMVFFM